MTWFNRLRGGLTALFRRSQVERDLDDEMQHYLEAARQAHAAAGLDDDAARRTARLEVGNLESAKDDVRDVGWEQTVESFWQDVRHTGRLIRKAPGFTAAVVVTIGLGIGGTTAVFSIVDALFLRAPGGVTDPGTLRRVFVRRDSGRMQTADGRGGFWPDAQHVREGGQAFAAIAAYQTPQAVSLGRGETATRVNAGVVSSAFFAVVGLKPALGRFFAEDDDEVPGAHPVIVIAHAMWRNRFGGAEDVLGRTLLVNNQSLEVIGVAPPGFVGLDADAVDVWLPSAMAVTVGLESDDGWRQGASMSTLTRHLARLRSLDGAGQAAAEASAALSHAAEATPELDSTPEVVLRDVVLAAVPGPSWAVDLSLWLLIAAGLVLVISCANVMNLLLARGLARRREIAMRLSLGAGPWRIARQQLTESAVLGLIGGGVGLAVAVLGIAAMRQFPLPPTAGHLDGRLLVFSLAVSLLAALAFGVLPAWRSRHIDPIGVLKGTGPAGAQASHRTRLGLVVLQVSLSFALLVGAALFIRSLEAVSAIRGGADLNRLMTVQVNLSAAGAVDEFSAYHEFFDAALSRLTMAAGVERAAVIHTPPFEGWGWSVFWRMPGQSQYQGGAFMNMVGPGYFETAGTRLLRGRAILATDVPAAESIAVVNEAMAERLTDGGNAIGMCVPFRGSSLDGMPCLRIVGIVESQRNTYLDPTPKPMVFAAEAQVPRSFPRRSMMLLVRTTGDASHWRGVVQSTLQGIRPDLPYVTVEPLTERHEASLRPFHLGAMLFSMFGVLALVLSAVGLYGVLGYFVAERTNEVGIRRALGAPSDSVMGLVVRQGLMPVAAGLGLGLALALIGSRVLESRLFGIGPHDPVSFGGAAVFLMVVASIATILPVWRALRIEPIVALRHD